MLLRDIHRARHKVAVPTGGWWVGQDNATLTEPASNRENFQKTRRLPLVGCIIPLQFRDAVLGTHCELFLTLKDLISALYAFFIRYNQLLNKTLFLIGAIPR